MYIHTVHSREREKERERETDRQTETERQRQRQRERQRESEKERRDREGTRDRGSERNRGRRERDDTSVQFTMVSTRLEKPICALPRLRNIPKTLPLPQLHCLSD